ncbi:MAG TPA: rhodanese-like domain-containing protein [Actinomycetota bacterium]|jgi:rhodanese-related sulfurtransferase|nr:rhodanese-like domain-containing protein [Actinomycetota bacterium]
MTETDLTQARGCWERRDDVQILDVREGWEWDAGHIDGSLHIPLNELLGGRMESLEKNRPVVAVCKTGNRSEVAALMLRARGYEAHNLEGGVEDWSTEGLPLVTDEGEPGRVA